MIDLVRKADGLSLEELDVQMVELLPAREQMQLIGLGLNVNLAPQVAVPLTIGDDNQVAVLQQQNTNQQNFFIDDSFNEAGGGANDADFINDVTQINDGVIIQERGPGGV